MLIIEESRIFARLRFMVFLTFTVASAIALFGADTWLEWAGSLLMLALLLWVTFLHFADVRAAKRVATFTPSGVIDEFGREFPWHELDRAWIMFGALNLKARSGLGHAVNLDPAQVGGEAVKAARAYLKQHAPADLTRKI
jgi:hypothetical protein